MERIWVLVADSARARLYLRGRQWDQLEQLEEHEHPEGRAHEGDLVSDQGTAVMQRGGQGQRRSSQPEVSATEHEARVFAHALAERLRRLPVPSAVVDRCGCPVRLRSHLKREGNHEPLDAVIGAGPGCGAAG
jgi:hypothetical protein